MGCVAHILRIEIIVKLLNRFISCDICVFRHWLTWCLFEFVILHTVFVLNHLLLEFIEVNEPKKNVHCLGINFLIRFQFIFERGIKCLDFLIFKSSLELGLNDLFHNHDVVFVDV